MANQDELHGALDEIRATLQADGADFEFLGWDPAAQTLRLRLMAETAECQECIIPEPMLSEITLASVQQHVPEVRAVEIDDPRVAG